MTDTTAPNIEEIPSLVVIHGYSFTVLPSEVLLSLKSTPALAIYAYLCARKAVNKDWQPRSKEIQEHFGIGRTIYQKGWNELKEINLAWTTKVRESGKVKANIMNISMVPMPEAEKDFIDRKVAAAYWERLKNNKQKHQENQLNSTGCTETDLRWDLGLKKALEASKNGDLFGSTFTVSRYTCMRCKDTGITDTGSRCTCIRLNALEPPENQEETGSTFTGRRSACGLVVNTNNNIKEEKTDKEDPLEKPDKYEITRSWIPDNKILRTIVNSNIGDDYVLIQLKKWLDWRFDKTTIFPRRHEDWNRLFADHVVTNWEKGYDRKPSPQFEKKPPIDVTERDLEIKDLAERKLAKLHLDDHIHKIKNGKTAASFPEHFKKYVNLETMEMIPV